MGTTVMGLDMSANRVAYAVCDSTVFYGSCLVSREDLTFPSFVRAAYKLASHATFALRASIACLEINLHPKLIHKGHVAANMVRAYMRSRWVEGAILAKLGFDEPSEITRAPGGFFKLELGRMCYALPATGGEDAKAARRARMTQLYAAGISPGQLSEDEYDALAIAHDCSIAIGLAERGV